MGVDLSRSADLHCCYMVLSYGEPEDAHLDDDSLCRAYRADGLYGGGTRQSLSRKKQRQSRAIGARVQSDDPIEAMTARIAKEI